MRRSAALAVAILAGAVAPASAQTGPAGFFAPTVVGSGFVGDTPAGSVGRDGRAALAWIAGPGKVVAVRGTPVNGRWGANEVVAPGDADGAPGREVHDVQVAVGQATIVAWAQARNLRSHVLAAAATPDGRFGRPQVVAEIGAARSARPRLVATTTGRAVLVWHDYAFGRPGPGALRFAVSEPGHRFGRPRVLSEAGLGAALVATSDGEAMAAWRVRGGLRAARLGSRSPAFGASFLVTRSKTSDPRLAAGPDGTVVASWAVVGGQIRKVTRRIRPLGRIEPVGLPDNSVAAPVVAVSAFGVSIATTVALPTSGPEARVATSTATGRWGTPQVVSVPHVPNVASPRAVVTLRGEALVVWIQAVVQPGTGIWEVVVARRPAGAAAFEGPVRLGPALTRADVVLALRGAMILAAWPSPDPGGGMLVASRPES